MERVGWAAAVGSLYQTRAGRTVRIVEYSVTDNGPAGISARILGSPVEGQTMFLSWTEDGTCRNAVPDTNSPNQAGPHWDLISMIRKGAK